MTNHHAAGGHGRVRLAPGAAGSNRVSDPLAIERPAQLPRERSPDTAETRRIGTKVVVPNGEAVLLIQECRADGTTFWSLPGGGRKRGEGLRECLRREVREELQCGVTLGAPIGTCTYRHSRAEGVVSEYAVFLGSLQGAPDPSLADGVRDVRWVAPESPPSGTLPPFRSLLGGLASEQTEK